jgi:hypothetical protein
MNIGAIVADTGQVQVNQVQAGAAVKIAAMGLDSMRQQGKDLTNLIQSAAISDPALGQKLNVLA